MIAVSSMLTPPATGPPASDVVASAFLAEEAINNNELSQPNSSNADEGGVLSFALAPLIEPTGDAMPRAPPQLASPSTDQPDFLRSASGVAASAHNAVASLTDQALAPVLDQALRSWISTAVNSALVARLANLEVRIADLPDGILGQTVGNLITIDSNADGHAWFIDVSPGESVEFGIILTNERLLADAGSQAFGRVDLLSVLLHEVGHVVGLDHGAGIAVMDEALGTGERVLFGSSAFLVRADGSVAGAVNAGAAGTLAADDGGDPDPITFTIVNHGGQSAIPDVVVSGAAERNGTYDDIGTIIGRMLAGDSVVLDINADTTWRLTGPDAGILTVAGFAAVNFARVENLTGAAGSRDTFFFEAGGSISGQVDGGSGAVVIGNGAGGDPTAAQSGPAPGAGVIHVGNANSAQHVEIGNAGATTVINQSLVISNPAAGGEVFVRGNIVATGSAGLSIFGSGHTTTIGPGSVVTTVLPGTAAPALTGIDQAGSTAITVAGDVTINDAVVLAGDAAITATAGNVRITNPGTLNGSVADLYNLSITTTGAGTVTLDGAIGATAKLKDLIINAAGDVVISGPISLAGRLSITSATGKITLGAAVNVAESVLLQANGATSPIQLNGAITAGTFVTSVGSSVVVDAAINTTAGNIRLEAVGVTGSVTVNKAVQSATGNITILGGKDVIQGAAGNLSTGGTSTIDVEATAGSITMAGGSLAQTAGGNIRYKAGQNAVIAQLDARKAGDRAASTVADQANWGKVNVIATSGSITDAVATANVYAAAARLSAGIGIGSADSSIALEVITVSAVAGSGGINLNDATQVTVDVVNQVAFNRVQANGTISTIPSGAAQSDLVTSSNGNIILRTSDGGIIINDGSAPADSIGINADGSGAVTLQAKGASQSITINTQVKSASGNISLLAPVMVLNPVNLVTTGTISVVTSASTFDVNQSGTVEWISQGPAQTIGGQVEGLDQQGNPVSGAIQAIAVDPSDPNIVYVASVNGGVWKTTNINATRLMEFNDPAKAAAADVSGVIYTVSDVFAFTAALDATVGNDGSGKFDPVPGAATTGGGGPAVKSFATLGSVAGKNRLIFTAAQNGTGFDGVSVVLADNLAAAGSETAHYDVATKRLTIYIKAGASTASQIRDAVNAAGRLTGGNGGSGAVATAVMKAVSASVVAPGAGFAPGITITRAGGSSTQAVLLTVQSVEVVNVLSVAVKGNGYAVGDILTVSGGTASVAARIKVLSVTAGQIDTVSVERGGSYTVMPTGSVAVIGGTGTGATFTLAWGVDSVTVTTAGTYSALPANPVAQATSNGAGSAAMFVLGWGVHSVSVTSQGAGYVPIPSVQASGGGGAGFTATAVTTAGAVTAVTVTTSGTEFHSIPTIVFSGNGGSGALATVPDLQAVSADVKEAGTGYLPGDTITITNANATAPAVFTVEAVRLISATIASVGSGYKANDILTLSGGTFGVAA